MHPEHKSTTEIGEPATWHSSDIEGEPTGEGSLNSVRSDGDQSIHPGEDGTSPPNTQDMIPETESNTSEVLQALTAAVHALRDDLRRSVEIYEQQRVLVDKLHSENEQLRRAELERARDPVVRDLISLSDTCLRNGRAWLQRAEATPDTVADVLQGVAEDVKMILERQGVETFAPEVGTKFDRREARVIRSASTSDASLDSTVAEVLKPGYRAGNRVIRYCEVVVYASEAASVTTPSDASGPDEPKHSGLPS